MAADLPKEVKAEFESAARSLALVHTHSADIYRHQTPMPRAGPDVTAPRPSAGQNAR
jgi:hypothetical protein